MNQKLTILISTLLILFLSSCAEVDSEDLKTSGIYTETEITAEENGTTVFVRMRTGRSLDADTVILSAGDQLYASLAGDTVRLLMTDSDAYQGTFPVSPGGATVTVSLTRLEDPDAPNSVVTLPNAFTIDAPGIGETFRAGEAISTVWTPAEPDQTVAVSYQLNCTVYDSNGLPSGANYGKGYTTVDSGTHTTSINDILNVFGTQDELVEDVSCPLEITVKRQATGTLDAALVKGGEITASRQKTVVVNVIP